MDEHGVNGDGRDKVAVLDVDIIEDRDELGVLDVHNGHPGPARHVHGPG